MSGSDSALLNCVCLFLFVMLRLAAGSKFNVSVTDLSNCKEFRLQSTYQYSKFFQIEHVRNSPESDELLRLKFYVMTTKDAHILLATRDKPNKSDAVYEIVIGAGGNTFSTLRRNIGKTKLALNSQPNILTPVDPTPIEIRQKIDGTLDIIIPGYREPHLSYRDNQPLVIKFVSFSTFGNTPARWFYDCKIDNETDQIDMETKNLTNMQQLQEDLFKNYSIYTIPENLKDIRFSFTIKGVTYDEERGMLKTRVEFKLKWQDNKLRWHPEKYDGLDMVHSSDLSPTVYHWTPTIIINNGADYTYNDFNPTYVGLIFSNGTLMVHSVQEVIGTWCIDSSYNWPYDDLPCDIMLSADGSAVKLVHDNTSPVDYRKQIAELSQWHLTAIEVFPDNTTSKKERKSSFDLQTPKTDLIIRLRMKRNQFFYRRVFFTPIVVACLTLLSSFSLSGTLRGGLNLFAVLIAMFTFMWLGKYAPVTFVPKLVHLYETVLIVGCLTYILHIVDEWLVKMPPISEPPQWISTIVNLAALRFVLGIQFVDFIKFVISSCQVKTYSIMLVILFLWPGAKRAKVRFCMKRDCNASLL